MSRSVRCFACPWGDVRAFGHGILVRPCPECGGRVGYATLWWPGEPGAHPSAVESYLGRSEPEETPAQLVESDQDIDEPVYPSIFPQRVRKNRPRCSAVVNRSQTGPVAEKERSVEPVRARDSVATYRPARRIISDTVKDEILEKQDYKCIYCARKLGSEIWDSKGRLVILSTRFDHFEPFALRFNDDPINFFAACKVCNELKSDHVFDSLKDCRSWLEKEWAVKGYSDHVRLAKFFANPALFSVN